MWAYAASRTLDFLLTLDYVDKSRVELWDTHASAKQLCGQAQRRTLYLYLSNDAGCSGDAIERGKIGERFPRIFTVLGYWFCENMKSVSESTDDAEKMPFDQHFLLACCAPRKLYITAASLDEWQTRPRSTSHVRLLLRLGSCRRQGLRSSGQTSDSGRQIPRG